MRGHGIHEGGFHALFYLSFFSSRQIGGVRRTETPRSKDRAAFPPPWFPPLESPFRGAPFPRYAQRGKPILLHRWNRNRWSLFWGKGANHCVVCPLGHGFELFIFTLAVGKSGRGLPLVAVWPVGPRPGGRRQKGEALDFRARKCAGLKAKSFMVCRSVMVLAA
jgi:hypothetical protein